MNKKFVYQVGNNKKVLGQIKPVFLSYMAIAITSSSYAEENFRIILPSFFRKFT